MMVSESYEAKQLLKKATEHFMEKLNSVITIQDDDALSVQEVFEEAVKEFYIEDAHNL